MLAWSTAGQPHTVRSPRSGREPLPLRSVHPQLTARDPFRDDARGCISLAHREGLRCAASGIRLMSNCTPLQRCRRPSKATSQQACEVEPDPISSPNDYSLRGVLDIIRDQERAVDGNRHRANLEQTVRRIGELVQ